MVYILVKYVNMVIMLNRYERTAKTRAMSGLTIKYVTSLSFFFSSRRRHTRWTGDWSSDVCSSDLSQMFHVEFVLGDDAPIRRARHRRQHGGETRVPSEHFHNEKSFVRSSRRAERSEERRVGKECR